MSARVETLRTIRELEERSGELFDRTRWLPRILQHASPDLRVVTSFHHVVPRDAPDPEFARILRAHPEPPKWDLQVPEVRDLGPLIAARWPDPPYGPLFELTRGPDGTWRLRFGPALSWDREARSLSALMEAVARELREKPADGKFY